MNRCVWFLTFTYTYTFTCSQWLNVLILHLHKSTSFFTEHRKIDCLNFCRTQCLKGHSENGKQVYVIN